MKDIITEHLKEELSLAADEVEQATPEEEALDAAEVVQAARQALEMR